MAEYIWIKLKKEWAGYVVGETFRCGLPKGPQLIEAGFGHEVPEPKAEKAKREKAEAEKKADEEKKAAEEAKLAEEKAAEEKAEAEKKAAGGKKTAEKATNTPDGENADNRPNPKETKKK